MIDFRAMVLCNEAMRSRVVLISLLLALGRSLAGAASTEPPKILPPNPGLDGGEGGHWGKQSEPDWRDNRWQQMDSGPFLASCLATPNGMVLKGLSIRVGEKGDGAVCYDTGSATLRAGWTGGFLKFDPARYGLIVHPKIGAEVQFVSPKGPGWGDGAKIEYRGFHLNGKRVVLEYFVNGVRILDSPWAIEQDGQTIFTREFEIAPAQRELRLDVVPAKTVALLAGTSTTLKRDQLIIPAHEKIEQIKILIGAGRGGAQVQKKPEKSETADLCRPGPLLWPGPIKVQGQLATLPGAYVIDTIPVPYNNPHNALMFLSGVDFFENGDAAVCSLHGDVWLVSGIDEKLRSVSWKRFATGLFQPLGLKIVKDQVFVLGRDRITILRDRNGDGEADYYESFHDGIKTSGDGHDYVTSLETDAAGNFYYVDPRGVHRVSSDGKQSTILATGFRNPNGMSVGPHGEITVAPQEGEWTPASMICEVRQGGHYGYGGPQIAADRPLGYDVPLCYLPRWIDNSTGSQIWVSSDRLGPLSGQLLNLSFGRSSMMLILREIVDGIPQGTVVPLPGRFLSGAVRAAFRKQDGQLYVVGTRGWSSNATRDGSFQRVRFTGKKAYLPLEFHAHENGIRIRFSEPLTRETVEDTGSYGIEQWNYKYRKEYGSPEYSVHSPDVVGHDPVDVASAKLLDDGQTVFLQIPNFRPVMQMQIKYNLKARDGQNLRGEVFPTIHKLSPAFSPGLAQR
jgi:hypothetical protein